MSAVYSSLSGQDAVFKQMQIIANNLANASTSGFKAERLVFEQALTEVRAPEASLKAEIEAPSTHKSSYYTNVVGSYTDFTQGAFENTNNNLNAAIQGEGLFVISTPNGERYTRSGEFKLDNSGRLVTPQGHPVLGSGGEIVASGGPAKILADGTVTVNNEPVGRIRIVKAAPQDLAREAAQVFRLNDGAATDEVADVNLVPGAVEQSNVNATRELTDMIVAARTLESLQKTNESSSRMSKARQDAFGKV